MSISVNGSGNPSKIICNGTVLSKVICNGVVVWTASAVADDFSDNDRNYIGRDFKNSSPIQITLPAGRYIFSSFVASGGSLSGKYFATNNITMYDLPSAETISVTITGGAACTIIKTNVSKVYPNGGGSWMYYEILNTEGKNSTSMTATLPANVDFLCLGIPGGNNQGANFTVNGQSCYENVVHVKSGSDMSFSGNYMCGGGDGGHATDNGFLMQAIRFDF